MQPLAFARAAVRRLKDADPILKRFIEEVGPCKAVASWYLWRSLDL